MKVLVTGAAGRLGRPTLQALAAAGHEVRGCDRVTPEPGFPLPVEPLDLLDPAAVLTAAAGAEAVVHLGNHPTAYGRIATTVYSENSTMNGNVFEAARSVGARVIVFASSVQAFTSERRDADPLPPSALPWLPLDGSEPAAPTNIYAVTKAQGEELLRFTCTQSGIAGVSLRFPMLLGEPPPSAGQPITGRRLDECFSWLTFADGARLIAACLRRPPAPGTCRTYFPAAPRPSLAAAPADLRQRYFATVPVRGSQPCFTSFVDLTPLQRDFGWSPVDL